MATIRVEKLIRDLRSWPEEDQRELADYARIIEARRRGRYVVSDDERQAIEEGLRQADSDDFVDPAALEQLAARHRA